MRKETTWRLSENRELTAKSVFCRFFRLNTLDTARIRVIESKNGLKTTSLRDGCYFRTGSCIDCIQLTLKQCCTNIVHMKNVTITLENEVSRWAKIWAAKNDTSVSKLLGQLLKERMLEEQGYHAAMQQFFSQTPTKLKSAGEHYPERDSLHER